MGGFRKIIPYKIRVCWSILRVYSYDAIRYFRYSAVYNRYDTEYKLKSFITKAYHVIEKGLTMPQTRLGFGKDGINELIRLCRMFASEGYDRQDSTFIHALGVLKEYLIFHERGSFKLDTDITTAINNLLSQVLDINSTEQRYYTKAVFFSKSSSPFEEFALSRRTVRHYTEEDVPEEIFQNCIKIASSSPSPCNRQPNRVYVVKNKEIIKEVLKLQNGNRGFGHLGNSLVIFTSDVSLFHDTFERNEAFLNSGKFCMSFIYSLHFYQVGSCCLNWSVSPERDKKLKKLLSIPEKEAITMTLICGKTPEKFYSAYSPKENWQDIMRFIK